MVKKSLLELIIGAAVFCTTTAAAIALANVARANESGYVFGVSGTWTLAPQNAVPLSLGQVLHRGEGVHHSGRSKTDAISIGLLNGKTLVIRCANMDCSKDVPLPEAPEAPGRHEQFDAIWNTLFNKEKPPVIFAMSRAVDTINSGEAVLPVTKLGLNISPALPEAKPGAYSATLLPLKGGSKEVRLLCHVDSTQGACDGTASPGVYRLRLSLGDAVSPTFAVLVALPATYDSDKALFEQASKFAANWPQMPNDARHYFLTAFLSTLANHRLTPNPV